MRSRQWRGCRGRIGAPRGINRLDGFGLRVTGQRRAEFNREGDDGCDVVGAEDQPQVGPVAGMIVNQSHDVHHQKKHTTAPMITAASSGRSFSTGRGF